MPSPFPGMDPYLESAELWKGFHDKLVVYTVEALQPELRERGYYIDVGERVWMAESERSIWPDELIVQSPSDSVDDGGGAVVVDEPVKLARMEEEIHESFADIFTSDGDRLITAIEFLSHANKSDARGRGMYERKQQELRESGVSLVEIDLLRAGRHVLDVPVAAVDSLQPWDYLVNLSRVGSSEYEIYPIRLPDRLPRIRIPLQQDDRDAVLDLAGTMTRAYDIGPYPARIDYTCEPDPPLSDDTARWVDELLKSKGLRQ